MPRVRLRPGGERGLEEPGRVRLDSCQVEAYIRGVTTTLESHPLFTDADLISVYTRSQAIEDGVLIDVTDTAREAGFVFPVAITVGVFADSVVWNDSNRGIQDEAGRLWDVLWMARNAARRGGDRVRFQVYRVPNTPKATQPRLVTLVAVCGPGDTAEPVVTIMLDGES